MADVDQATRDEMGELLTDLRAASADARMLAARYAELLKTAVDAYCVEFDARALALIEKMGDAQ